MPDFWRTCGYHLLHVRPGGGLVVSDDFLRAYLLRPELRPVPTSCADEIALHEDLLADPRRALTPERLERLADPDARENYRVFLRFRDHLLAHPTLDAAWLDLVRSGAPGIPPLFLDHLVQVVLRHLLRDCQDPVRLRAAELLFREQKVTIQDGAVLLADEETVEMRASGHGAPGRLLTGEASARTVELDVLDERNAATYWRRSDAFDTVLDIGFTRPGLDAFCRVLEAWVRHFARAEVMIQPVRQIRDERWVWHTGLDAEASAILNDLYAGHAVGEDRLARLLALFRLDFRDPGVMLERVRGRPVHLGLAMNGAGRLKVKPQNVLLNLPLARPA